MLKVGLYLSCACAAFAAPAYGQDIARDEANQTDQKSSQQDKADTAASDPVSAEDIIVTGFRASLYNAAQIKRESDAIVDAIVAEDIGKLPDNNAAESLARISGVQVSRSGDEANQVLVRGLPDVATTFNGRDIFTAESRGVALWDFPPGALRALEVFKSGTADLVEPGLAGLINVRTWRPFDFKGFEIAGAVRGTYNDQSKKYDPANANLQITDRWQTGIGEIGALINFAYTQQQFRNAARWNSADVLAPDVANTVEPESVGRDFVFPEAVGVFYNSGIRKRPSINASLQWKPAPNLEIYVDGLWQAYRGRDANDFFATSLRFAGAQLSNVVLDPDEPNKVASLTKTGGWRPDIYRSTVNGDTNTYQGAIGAIWTTGKATISTDFAYTDSTFKQTEWSLDSALTSAPTVDAAFDVKGSAAFSLPGFDATDPSHYQFRGFFDRTYVGKGNGIQWRGDISLETDIPFLPQLQVGSRVTTRNSSVRSGSRYAYLMDLGIGMNELGLGAMSLVDDSFRGGVQGFTQWLAPERSAIRSNIDGLRAIALAGLQQLSALNPNDAGLADNVTRWSSTEVPIDPLASWEASEKTYAAYAQGKYAFDIGGVDVGGLVGVRIVNTDGVYSGTSLVDGVQTPEQNRQNYVDVLPNVSMRIRPTDKLQVRLAYTETRTRPTFGQLNPAVNITRAQNTGGTPGRYDAFGRAGNRDLAPLTSRNYDGTIEYYFSPRAAAGISVFYRDLDGFISDYTRDVQDPVYGLIQVVRPENAGSGRIKGIEAGFHSFFDFLPGWLSGFGVQANATYLDGKNQLPNALGQDTKMVAIPGVSKWSYNAVLFYERGKLSTRLSYNYRSKFTNFYSPDANGNLYVGEGTKPIARLDYSLSYTVIPAITITADVSNILGKPFNNYRYFNQTQTYPRDIRYEGRYFGLGTRFRF
nr:TonB-dependent receptor [uncultured Novosphingobium sp.]